MTINRKYCLLQMSYWMIYAVAFGFATYYLQERGISASTVGFIIAAAGVLAALISPQLGKLSDQGRVSWKNIMMVLGLLYGVLHVLMLLTGNMLLQGILFGLFLMLVSCYLPLINGAGFYYEHHGESVNFGVARGLGSLFYAVMAYVLGAVTGKLGCFSVPAAGVAAAVFLFGATLLMPCEREVSDSIEKKEKGNGIFRTYPAFFIVVAGCVLLLSSHNIVNNYMINIMESVGGDSSTMGKAIALSAVLELPAMFSFSQLVKKISVERLLVIAAVFFACKAFFFFIAGSVAMVYLAQCFQLLSFAVFVPASVYYSEQTMKKEDKMKGQAFMAASMTVGSVIGSLAGGYVIEFMGLKWALAVSVLFTLLGLILVVLGIRKKRG